MTGNYRVYRNLHKNCFSVQTKVPGKGWRVTDYATTMIGYGVSGHVRESGRLKVLETRTKNVHAWLVVDDLRFLTSKPPGTDLSELKQVRYNPYTMSRFMVDGREMGELDCVLFHNNRIFLNNTMSRMRDDEKDLMVELNRLHEKWNELEKRTVADNTEMDRVMCSVESLVALRMARRGNQDFDH